MARILVIDDEADVRTLLQQELELAGHTVALAANGTAGLKLLGEQNADLVITDIFMPDKEGIETIREIRQRFPKIGIIAISGGGNLKAPAYLFTASELGASSVLQKPFDRRALLQSVDDVLNAPAP